MCFGGRREPIRLQVLLFAAALSLVIVERPASCGQLDELALLAVSPTDGKGAIRMPTGELRVVNVGDTLPGTQAVVREVLPDRLVLTESVADDASEEPAMTRRVWLFKARGPDLRSRVQVLDPTPPPEADALEPAAETTSARSPPPDADAEPPPEPGNEGGDTHGAGQR
jgi:hypothetical protein